MACSVPTAAIHSEYHALILTLGYTTCATKQEDTWCSTMFALYILAIELCCVRETLYGTLDVTSDV